MSKLMYVYIMSNGGSYPTLYTGVTNDLIRRVHEHKQGVFKGFTAKYKLHRLVYFEVIEGQLQGIVREKQIKDMNRRDKISMIMKSNSIFLDLYPGLVKEILVKPE